MKRFLYSLVGLSISLFSMAQLPMEGWRMHTAYNYVTRVEMASDKVYALSEGALFAVDKDDQSISYYNRLTGLSSTNIADMCYDASRNMLILAYTNGYIDLLVNDEVTTVSDLYGAAMSYSKEVNHILVHGNKAYLSMDFGILVLNLQREEIADTYYIGENASALDVTATAVVGDSIYAAVGSELYVASLHNNLVDFSCWKIRGNTPATGTIQNLLTFDNHLYASVNGNIYVDNGGWVQLALGGDKITHMRVSGGKLLAFCEAGTWMVDAEQEPTLLTVYTGAPDAVYDNLTHIGWFAYYDDGVGCFDMNTSQVTNYLPSGPITNTAYRMRFQGERLYVVPGGYLGKFYNRPGLAMVYERGNWLNYSSAYMKSHITNFGNPAVKITEDYSDIIGDPTDPSHFFIASFGYGLMEFRKDTFYTRHMPDNSGIDPVIESPWEKYTWVDAFAYDPSGNLWMANPSKDNDNIKVLTTSGEWFSYDHTAFRVSERVKNIIVDSNNPNIKYIVGSYNKANIGIIDDKGTFNNQRDDQTNTWKEFVDEDGNNILPNYMHSVAQDKNGALWVGTEAGLLKFSQPQNLLTSNACSRIKIARTDGSGLADYLLGEEIITAIAVDGANRLWFGTETSGAYLMDLSDPQNIVTVHHYTTDNSPLPSNNILSIAINPITGEVFFGTGGGILSYQSDAAEGKEDYTGAYAYPNPVRENFDGVITIAGLMEDTQVRITDNAGNLVYETKSNGGLAIWDGKNGRGERVSSGVYFAMCVTADGANKTLVKILVMN